MIYDITQNFVRNAQNQNQQKAQQLPLKTSIQSILCYKKASDLFESLEKIQKIMVQNKANYFSNAAYSCEAFTDQQRSQFDQQIKNSLNITNMQISQFKNVIEELQAHNTTQKQHMRGIALCIYQVYKNISKLFREFLQFSQNRKRKLQNAISLDAKNQFKIHNNKHSEKDNKQNRKVSEADEQLEKQSKMIYMQKISEHKKIQDTRIAIEKINQVLDKMENKVLEQEVLTSSFCEIGEVGLFHIDKGNKNLVQANAISKQTGKYWTIYFLTLAISLLILDFIKS